LVTVCSRTISRMQVRGRCATAGLVALAMAAACGQTPEPAGSRGAGAPPSSSPQASPTAPPAAAQPAPPEPASTPPPTDEAIARMLAPWSGDLSGMVERRYIRMLVTFSKTNYFLDGPQQRGATFEAGRLFENFLNARLKSKHIRVSLAFIPVTRDRIFQALAEGRGDIAAAALTVTERRRQTVDFAAPFVSDVRELVVTAADQPPVNQAEDLSGRKVHVRRSSAYHDSLMALNASLRAAGKPLVTVVDAPEQLEDEDLLEMVNAGLIPTTVVDDYKADLWSRVFDRIRVQPAVVHGGGQIAWALRKRSPELREAIDAFVKTHGKGSLAFNVVTQRYFKSTAWVKNAASEAELAKFRQAVSFFKRYGDQYELPWLLVAAQAYQESTIDQNKKSSAGAVGVMQIKPETAAGDPINIRGVEASAEQNIHAGVKYLRFIADRYYKDQPMDRVNKGLFAMASYNAGPARISQLREKAKRMGLDPNQWFGHVEVVAAREIGRETVQYVSNIYKYYVSYQLIQEQRDARLRARGS
jgi:membrane-bound lytic murein transglycosylase MltF